MDHLQAIRIFARVVETGGFSRAAQSLQMPNATVSKWVKSLEEHLGVKLLERSTRSVNVTTDGVAYYERIQPLLTELDDIEATLGREQANPRGALRVDSGGSTASGVLIPALPAFCARYPDIQVQLSVTDRTADLIAESIDCAIRSTSDDPALVTHAIGALRWTTCASPAYLAAHGTPLHPRQIVDDRHAVVGYFSASSGVTQPLRFVRDAESIVLDGVRYAVLVSISRPRWRASVSCTRSISWCVRRWRAASSCRFSPTGGPRRCRFISPIRRAAGTARRCACSPTG
jgi:DNA-binding transcriptional LysR family regulator